MGRNGRRSHSSARARLASALALAGLAVLTAAVSAASALSGHGPTPAASSTPGLGLAAAHAFTEGELVLRVAFDAGGRGIFTSSGAISDSGAARAHRSQEGRKVRLTQTLTGRGGTLVIRVEQRCGRRSSTWSVLRGTGSYAGTSGGGTGAGSIPCGPARAFRGTYRGAVSVPTSQAPAVPGPYGGWTAQSERVTFDVLAGGRTVGNIRIERLSATCTPPLDVVVEPAFLSTYPIAADGTFTATFASSTISGRLSGTSATGTVTYSSSGTPGFVCTSGAVGWTASSPPPPLPAAVPGSYCGSTTQDRGVCLTLSPNGRVTYLRIEAQLECVLPVQARFEVYMGFGGVGVPLRSNLSFEALGSIEGETGGAGDYVLRGTFDSAGKVSGTLSLHRTSYDDQEGRIYVCKNASFGWKAARTS